MGWKNPWASLRRRWPLAAALVPALLLSIEAGSGCGHRRQAMRPVIVAPPPPAVLVPDNCPTPAVVPGVAPVVTPGFEDPGTAPSTLAPAAPAPGKEPPLVPSAAEEIPPTAVPAAPTGRTEQPLLQGPSASLGTSVRVAPRAALRARLEPFVNDPNDLFLPPKADRPWRYIVLHHSAHNTGNYAEIDREHRQVLGWEGCGYHFVIGNGSGSPDGQIEVARRWADQKGGAHCRNAKSAEINEYGIGICLIGNFDDASPTPRQVEAARALVGYLRQRYDIPADHTATHSTLASGPTACPGKHFPTPTILSDRGLAARIAP